MYGANLQKTTIAVIIVLSITELTAFALPSLQNGDFSEPNLAGWTIVSEPVISLSGVALFLQDTDEEGDLTSALGQEFKFPMGAETLSFDIVMTTMGGHETDTFTASLYDNDTGLPLVSLGPGIDEFFSIDSSIPPNPPDPIVITQTVTLDVSGFQDAYLLFNLYTDLEDELTTTIKLDNVAISVVTIPAPGAFVLAGIGISCVTWLRRRRTL